MWGGGGSYNWTLAEREFPVTLKATEQKDLGEALNERFIVVL